MKEIKYFWGVPELRNLVYVFIPFVTVTVAAFFVTGWALFLLVAGFGIGAMLTAFYSLHVEYTKPRVAVKVDTQYAVVVSDDELKKLLDNYYKRRK